MNFTALNSILASAVMGLIASPAYAATVTETIWLTGHRGLQDTGVALDYTSDSGIGLEATGHYLNGDGSIGAAAKIGEYSFGLGITTPDTEYESRCFSWRIFSHYDCTKVAEDSHQIDGKYTPEIAKLTFDHEVRVEKVWFSYVEHYWGPDNFAFSFMDGGGLTTFTTDIPGVITGFASYEFTETYEGTMFGFGAPGSHDDFKLKGIKYSYHKPEVIPLPAAAWLLLAGVAGLAAMKRRKTA